MSKKGIGLSVMIVMLFFVFSCSNTQNTTTQSGTVNTIDTKEIGKTLFNQNCKMCHGFNEAESNGLAPILDSVKTHWPQKNELVTYIKNAKESETLNKHTIELFEKWKDKPQMPPFLGLSDDEVIQIADYLYSNSK